MTTNVLTNVAETDTVPSGATDYPFAVETRTGERQVLGSGRATFVVRVPDREYWTTFLKAGPYRVGMAFIRGDVQVDGDLLQAVRWWHAHRALGASHIFMSLVSRLRVESWFQTVARARANIRFHYDRSNAFYRQFLDERMVYSCAYFTDPTQSLDAAQLAKLDHICRKLDISESDRFLDVGCGWGALVIRAAERYGARVLGCTLSSEQYSAAMNEIRTKRLDDRAKIHECDYRDLTGAFDKIASVGMFEHVGRNRLRSYFAHVASLLAPGGLFLNHGIARPSSVHEDGGTVFLQRRVFPGGELVSLADVVSAAEHEGFEVLDVENLRRHYALTTAAWVARLQQHRNACLSLVDAETYRTWLLYLAAASVSFELGQIEIHQVLLAKRPSPAGGRMTRSYMYDIDTSDRKDR